MKKFFPDSVTDFHIEKEIVGETITAIHHVDIGSAVEDAKRHRDYLETVSSRGEEMRPVMEIPGILIEKYCIDRGITLREFFSNDSNGVHIKAVLLDPSLKDFRLRSAYRGQ